MDRYTKLYVVEPLRLVFSNVDLKILTIFQGKLNEQLAKSSFSVQNSNSAPVEVSELRNKIELRTKRIAISLVHESMNVPPLLAFKFEPILIEGNDQRLRSTISIKGNCYNIARATWEPFLENFKFSFSWSIQSLNETLVTIKSKKLLNLNYTHSFINNLNIWTKELERGDSSSFSSKFRGIHFKNMLDQTVHFKLSGVNSSQSVPPNTQIPIETSALEKTMLTREIDILNTQNLTLSIGKSRFSNLPISQETFKEIKATDSTPYVYGVKVVNGQRMLSIRGLISIKNLTEKNLEIILTINSSRSSSNSLSSSSSSVNESTTVIEPGEEMSVPSAFVKDGNIRMRPESNEGEGKNSYSKCQSISCSSLEPCKRYVTCNYKGKEGEKKEERGDFQSVHFCLQISKRSTQGTVIEVSVPMILENVLASPMEFSVNRVHKGSLESGETRAFHQISLGNHLEISIRIEGYEWSEAVKIDPLKYHPKKANDIFILKDSQNRNLYLYFEAIWTPNNSFAISVFAKFWIYNQTEFNLILYNHKDTPASGQNTRKITSTPSSGSIFETLDRKGEDCARDLANYSENWYNREEIVKRDPLIYSYGQPAVSQSKIQIENSKLSQPVSFEILQEGEIFVKEKRKNKKFEKVPSSPNLISSSNSNNNNNLSKKDSSRILVDSPSKEDNKRRIFCLGIKVEIGQHAFRRTKMVFVSPRFIFLNKCGRKINYQQVGHPNRFRLEHNQVLPFHWPDPEGVKEINVTMGREWGWSGNLPLTLIGDTYLGIRKISKIVNSPNRSSILLSLSTASSSVEETDENQYFLRVQMKMNEKGSILVIFKPKTNEFFPYRIENKTNSVISFNQLESDKIHQIFPNSVLNYTWDHPARPHSIMVETPSGNKKKVNLDKIKIRNYNEFKAVITAKGPERICKIYHSDLVASRRHSSNSMNSNEENEEGDLNSTKKDQPKSSFYLFINLDGIGISMVDNKPQEIAYVYLQTVELNYDQKPESNKIEAKIKSIQIDNQKIDSLLPVFIKPCNLPEDTCVFNMLIKKSNLFTSLDFYEEISIGLKELNVSMDSSFLNRLLTFVNTNLAVMNENRYSSTSNWQEKMLNTEDSTRLMYIQSLSLAQIRANITFFTVDEEDENTPLRMMMGGAVDSLPNIENAPLKVKALNLNHPFCSQQQLMDTIMKYFISQAIRGSYKILGSAEFLGNPVSIVSNLGTGFKDFFYEPFAGIAHGPKEFGRGLSKGSKSLAKKSVYGLFSGGSKITANVTSTLSKVSMDSEYAAERKQKNLSKPQNVAAGLKEGAKGLGKGFFEGFGGIIIQPTKGFREEGFKGLAKGIGRGIVGLPIKPVNGLVDLATKTMQGVYNSVSDLENYRMRPPRSFQNGILSTYSLQSSIIQFILASMDDKYSEEVPVGAFLCSSALYFITDRHLFSLHEKEGRRFSIHWKVFFKKVFYVTKKEGSLDINIGTGKSKENTATTEKHVHAEENNYDMLFAAITKEWNASKDRIYTAEELNRPSTKVNYFRRTMAPLTGSGSNHTTPSRLRSPDHSPKIFVQTEDNE
eukprot:TRINITY_DN2542_c0_g3_i1.p1 TRINITY_DN2542_c0_g3~~TRINITY_DN2542_c0_g3_i1.p1  ORF type:complete len:1711 (+),score=625.62 TRINITY_DN2542_c0_g3_i1:479-5134(+)